MLEREPEGTIQERKDQRGQSACSKPSNSKSTNLSRVKVACVQCATIQILVKLKIRQKAMGGSVNEAIEREEETETRRE